MSEAGSTAEAPRSIELYFDFVSPYSYLALSQAEVFARGYRVDWIPRPVVYGVLLDRNGLVGPAETEAKRRYTILDITRAADLLDLPLTGPPAHPFRSLEALRTVCLHLDEPEAMDLSVALSRACWGDGRDLTDPEVIAGVVDDVGLDAEGLAERIREDRVKRTLRELTEAALEAGVFGVPTFRYRGELFWGHDRLPHLAARLGGVARPSPDRIGEVLRRPRGSDRSGSPTAE